MSRGYSDRYEYDETDFQEMDLVSHSRVGPGKRSLTAGIAANPARAETSETSAVQARRAEPRAPQDPFASLLPTAAALQLKADPEASQTPAAESSAEPESGVDATPDASGMDLAQASDSGVVPSEGKALSDVLGQVNDWAPGAWKNPPGKISNDVKNSDDSNAPKDAQTAPTQSAKNDKSDEKEGEQPAEDQAAEGNEAPSDEGGQAPVQQKGDYKQPPASVHAVAAQGVRGGGSKLPYLDRIQKSFGRHDVSNVRAHIGSDAVAANRQLGSLAYATGEDVAFASPTLHTAAHEAAHVIQQRAGVSLTGGVGAVGDRYETHADRVADAVVRGESAEAMLDEYAGGATKSSSAATQKAVQKQEPDGGGPILQPDAAGGVAMVDNLRMRPLQLTNDLAMINTRYTAINSAYSAACSRITQAVAAALNSEKKMEPEANQAFTELREAIGELSGGFKKLKRAELKIAAVTAQVREVANKSLALEAEIRAEKDSKRKTELEEKYKKDVERATAVVDFAYDLGKAAITGNPMDGVEAVVSRLIKGSAKLVIEDMYSRGTEAEVNSLNSAIKMAKGQIKYAKAGEISSIRDQISSNKQEAATCKSEANTKIKTASDKIAERARLLRGMSPEASAGVSRIMQALDGYTSTVTSKDPEGIAASAEALQTKEKDFHTSCGIARASLHQGKQTVDAQIAKERAKLRPGYGSHKVDRLVKLKAQVDKAIKDVDTIESDPMVKNVKRSTAQIIKFCRVEVPRKPKETLNIIASNLAQAVYKIHW